jgi:nucleoside-diphosphate-sugar epimerase
MTFKPGNHIGITGAGGFVGKNLSAYLNDTGYNIDFLNFNSRPLAISSEISIIIHLAGKAHDIKNVSKPEEYYQVNYELTKEIYDSFLRSSATKFIFLSSVKAVRDYLHEDLTENFDPQPKTPYGKSKLMAERYIQNQLLPKGKSYYILRPCMIHGPGNKGNLNLLYKFVSNGLPYPLAAFENKRSFLSIENLCFIIKELIGMEGIPSGIYNIADDDPLSTNEVVSLLSESFQRSPKLLRIPTTIIEFIAKSGDVLRLPLNTERLQKLTENYIVSNKKIKDVLKKKLPLSAREGILLTARSFKDA